MRGRIGQRRRPEVRRRGRAPGAGPDQHFARFVAGELFGVDEFGLEILEVVVVQRKAALEGPIRQPALALQQVEDAGQEVVKRHAQGSISRSPWSRRKWTKS